MLSSPCGNFHAFGAMAEAHAQALTRLVHSARLPLQSSSHARLNATVWRRWRVLGNFLRCTDDAVCTGVACRLANYSGSQLHKRSGVDRRSAIGACDMPATA